MRKVPPRMLDALWDSNVRRRDDTQDVIQSRKHRHGPVERYPLFEIVQELAQDSRGVVDALDDNESEKWNQIMREIDSASE
jgi:hypothetical protein